MADPTPEELQARIEVLEGLITAEYSPPQGPEYSFPVANQGITQEQFRLMFLGQANGMIHGDNGTVNDSPNSTGYRYYLEGHDSDAETNQRNTLLLRAGTSAESIVEGFYHRLTEDMELSFPPVTTTTLYHVTLTYDPRRFKTDPVRVEVWPGEPPTQHGRVHVILHTVERRPNQLLTQATRTRYRPYTAGVVSVQNPNQLPDPMQYPAGTLAIPSSGPATGAYVRSNTVGDWANIMLGPEEFVPRHSGNRWTGNAGCRRRVGGLDVWWDVTNDAGSSSYAPTATMIQLPSKYALTRTFNTVVFTTRGPANFIFRQGDTVVNGSLANVDERPGWTRGNVFIPDYYLA